MKNLPLILCSVSACSSVVAPTDDPPRVPSAASMTAHCASEGPGRRLLRRLTYDEVEATVRDVFGLSDSEWQAELLPPDSTSTNGFSNQADRLTVSPLFAEALAAEAHEVADLITTPERLHALLPCSTAGDAACAATFLDTYGRRLYRRHLTPTEAERYLTLLTDIEGITFRQWVHGTTKGLLQSPHMVYRTELGSLSPDGTWVLSPDERAAAIAYTYTGVAPTLEMMNQAQEGALETAAGRLAMAADLALAPDGTVREAFRTRYLDFSARWLGYSSVEALIKDPVQFPAFSPDVATSMKHEADTFIEHVVLERRGSMRDLITTPTTWVDATLARWYGLPEEGEVTRFDGWGTGVTALGAIMAVRATANTTSPTLRGLAIRERLLCQETPPPPADIPELPPYEAAQTTRERYESLHAPGSCQTCHVLFDPIGFAYEHIDAAGRYRALENGHEIDSSGVLAPFWPDGDAHADIPFRDAVELATLLGSQQRLDECYTAYAASYTYGLDTEEAFCIATDISERLNSGELNLVEVFLELAGAPHLEWRSPAQGPSTDPDPIEEPFPDTDAEQKSTEPGPPMSDTADSCAWSCTALPGAPASDAWCQTNCLYDPPYCPADLCVCISEDCP